MNDHYLFWVGGNRCGWVTDCEKNCLKEMLGQI